MTDPTALYQQLILDHSRKPRNFGELAGADRRAEGRNPMCGDALTVWLRLEGDTIADVSFVGTGCAISKASASLMTAAVKGKTRSEAEALFARFHDLVSGVRQRSADHAARIVVVLHQEDALRLPLALRFHLGGRLAHRRRTD